MSYQYKIKARTVGSTVEILRQAHERIRFLEALLSEKWISVQAHLPKEDGQYLVVRKTHGRPYEDIVHFTVNRVGNRIPAKSFWTFEPGYSGFYIGDVTHWMELPLLPKEECK